LAFPTRPNIAYSYSEFAEGLGDGSFPGSQVDNDLANLENSANTIIDFLGSTFRTDGQLTNGSVKPEALSSSVLLGFAPPRLWVTGTTYAVNDSVFNGVQYYICLVAHTAGTFSTDLSAGKWALLADFTALVSDEGLDPTLSAIAAVTTAANKVIYATGVDTFATADFTAIGRSVVGAADAAAVRTAIGISATNTPFTPAGSIAATTVQAALAELDSEKVGAASPAFTGTVTIGDTNFKLELSGGNPYFIATPGDYIVYDRAGEYWAFFNDSVERFRITTTGVTVAGAAVEPRSTASSGVGQVQAVNVASSAYTTPNVSGATYEYAVTGYNSGLVVDTAAGVAAANTLVYNNGSAGEVRGYIKRLT
jgi:hypothetical protein